MPADREQVGIWCCDADGVEVDEESIDSLLTAAERDRAERFAFPHLRRRYRIARAAIRRILATRLGQEPTHVEMATRPGGKPFVPGGPAFNMSSSGPWLLIGVGARVEFGVDIEIVRELDDMFALARRHFSEREYGELEALAETSRARGFIRGWARKEAVAKALGKGLAMDLRSFSIPLDTGDTWSPVTTLPGFPDRGDWFIRPLRLVDETESAIAANAPIEIGPLYRIGRDLSWTEESTPR